MSQRHNSPSHTDPNYKHMYDELRIDKERDKATVGIAPLSFLSLL